MPTIWRIVAIVLILPGCAVQPTPVTSEEVRDQVAVDRQLLAAASEPVDGPISIYEAMARAVAFNLDLNLERYKTDLVEKQLSLSRHDQLPGIVVDHTTGGRSNYSGGSSQSLLTGQQSLESSTSADRYSKSNDLGLSWNILDFGVSYYRAKQAADRVLLANEQQKSVVNRILKDVQNAYWRAVSYERLIERLESLMAKVAQKLDESRQIEAQGLDTPLATLLYQRELLDSSRHLYELYEDLTLAKIELASLMNVSAQQDFKLLDQPKPTQVKPLPFDPELMETIALENRTELKEVTYQKRINANEVKAAFVGILPGLNLDYAHNYNSNSFLFNTDWTDYSARISWNLLDVFRYPATKALAEAQADTLDAQRLALSAAVLTQVHIGVARYKHTSAEYLIASAYNNTQDKIRLQIQFAVKAKSASEQTLIKEEMNALLAEVRYDVAYAKLEGAFADLFSAIGISPTLEELDSSSLTALAASLEKYYEDRHNRSNEVLLNKP